MIRLDVQGLTADVFNRLRVDAAGAAVRALLGAGTAGVIPAQRLDQIPLPAGPFLALRRLPIIGGQGGPHVAQFLWFVYDEAPQGYYRISGLLRPIAEAYTEAPLPTAHAAISDVEVSAGEERIDPALQRPVCPVTLTLYC